MDSGVSKPWNNGDELLKKFISDGPDGEETLDRCEYFRQKWSDRL